MLVETLHVLGFICLLVFLFECEDTGRVDGPGELYRKLPDEKYIQSEHVK